MTRAELFSTYSQDNPRGSFPSSENGRTSEKSNAQLLLDMFVGEKPIGRDEIVEAFIPGKGWDLRSKFVTGLINAARALALQKGYLILNPVQRPKKGLK